MTTSLSLLRAVREDVAQGHWAKCSFAEGGQRCLIAGTRHHLGWEVFSEPMAVKGIPIKAYREAVAGLATAISRVYPKYVASTNLETIISFNDAEPTTERRVIEVLDAAILDIDDAILVEA